MCQNQICANGECSGECNPSARRCDPNDGRNYMTCGSDAQWSASLACGSSQTCVNEGQCVAQPCSAAMSPDWYSPAQIGGNPSLDDPRWGSGPLVQFAGSFGVDPGGYVIVFDRAAGELAVTMRATLGASETPDATDQVYFGITANQGSGPTARNVLIPLVQLEPGEGPQAITTFQTSEFSGSWRATTGTAAAWLEQLSEWRGATDATLSWAVSFRVNLPSASVDPSQPFRIALRIHAPGTARDLTTPANLDALLDRPASWPLASFDTSACVQRVALLP
jgi:hypothetical protein